MKSSQWFWKMAAVAVTVGGGGSGGAYAQSTPTQTWTPGSTCTQGLPTPSASDGTFIDSFGANWAVQCGQDDSYSSYDPAQGTNGHGIYSCFRGCDNRPGCIGFTFYGVVDNAGGGPTTGAGQCFYKQGTGPYFSSNAAQGGYTLYAGARLISNGTPSKACPAYNGTIFTNANNINYQILCGQNTNGVTGVTQYADSMEGCMLRCDAMSTCTFFSYTYVGSEPREGNANTNGVCVLQQGAASPTSNPTAAVAIKVGTTSVPTPTGSPVTASTAISSSTATSSSTAAAAITTCTLAPVPSVPACPSGNNIIFTDTCGTNYTVNCGFDSTVGASSTVQVPANNILACMQQCDAYAGCRSATLGGTNCYLKLGVGSLTANTNLVTIIRYIPPNPNYAVPPTCPGGPGCSTGCGSVLPAGMVPDGASTLVNAVGPDGLPRSYLIHIPKLYNPNRAAPIIFGFHGNNADAPTIESQTGMNDAATNPYAIAVYVNGYGRGYMSNPAWSPGGQYANVDDLGFMNLLISNLTSSFCVDTTRLFAVGHSNGGGFVNVLACDPVLSVKIAAFAGSSAAMYTNFTTGNPSTIEPVNTVNQPVCSPGRNNTPIIEFHGTADTQILYNGDTTHNGRILPSLPHWATAWSVRLGLDPSNYTTYPSNNVAMYQFGGLTGQLGIITHYRLTGWIHAYAKVSAGAPIDCTPPIMDFFYKWSDPNRQAQFAPVVSSSTSSTHFFDDHNQFQHHDFLFLFHHHIQHIHHLDIEHYLHIQQLDFIIVNIADHNIKHLFVNCVFIHSIFNHFDFDRHIINGLVVYLIVVVNLFSNEQLFDIKLLNVKLLFNVLAADLIVFNCVDHNHVPYTSPNFICPRDHGQTYTDPLGKTYMIGCGTDLNNGGAYYDIAVGDAGSFNDCFYYCSTNYQDHPVDCGAVAYFGGNGYGVGPGRCYFNDLRPQSFKSSNWQHVAMIRMDYYQDAPYTPGLGPPTTTTTTTATATPTWVTCPDDNGRTVTDGLSIQYSIGCGNDTSGGNYNVYIVYNGASDCFNFCDNSQQLDGQYCTGWTYSGGANGVGYGTCFVKSFVLGGIAFTPGNDNLVAAIRISPPDVQTTANTNTPCFYDTVVLYGNFHDGLRQYDVICFGIVYLDIFWYAIVYLGVVHDGAFFYIIICYIIVHFTIVYFNVVHRNIVYFDTVHFDIVHCDIVCCDFYHCLVDQPGDNWIQLVVININVTHADPDQFIHFIEL
ncbi:uncharacterized protein LTR77_000485 [Saxophila tyrrhenica]|uniref:feruloyl esterase n=1 Tax=Saxophila tyrrhenica TaxID=1690608 RepID=A0AAV9PMZ4_9PEZI|nr:hypothetical protein LTR77_000485 [Saxophila tyrrhenica]